MKSLVNLNRTKIWLIGWSPKTYGWINKNCTFDVTIISIHFSVVKQSATRSYSNCLFLCWFKLRQSSTVSKWDRHLLQEVIVVFFQGSTTITISSSRRMWTGWTLQGGLIKQIVAVRIKSRRRTFKFPCDEVISWIKVMRIVHFTVSDEFNQRLNQSCKRKK